ncbi:hypothetical protein [Deinococcus enclensis]|uniref:Lipoprotein n=1 Tax=Deinococcus enclensis TaxID=1049582 RepID=A0ABT9MIP8_9DEIO|nr:hypothetical protein [Deinococcus enclensis]MDP9766475.1 hypothetical protein [Deinococcus enclensis]
MKRLLILAAVLLSACAPVAQLAQPGEKATLTRDGQSLLLTNPAPDALTGDPGRAGDGPALTVNGTADLALDETARAWCQPVTVATGRRYACNLPTVPAGQRQRVTWTAGQVTDAAVLGYRPGLGPRPVLIWLE